MRDYKIWILSQPKAGTHFFAQLLKEIGYNYTYFHIDESYIDPYDPLDLESGRTSHLRNRVKIKLSDSVKLVRKYDVVVSHIPHSRYAERNLSEMFKLYVHREARVSLISYMRFYLKNGRHGALRKSWGIEKDPKKAMFLYMKRDGKYALRHFRKMSDWKMKDSVITLKYEDFRSGNDQEYKKLFDVLNVKDLSSAVLLEAVTQQNTLTRSLEESSLAHYWSGDAEKLFRDYGGDKLNSFLGYNDEDIYNSLGI